MITVGNSSLTSALQKPGDRLASSFDAGCPSLWLRRGLSRASVPQMKLHRRAVCRYCTHESRLCRIESSDEKNALSVCHCRAVRHPSPNRNRELERLQAFSMCIDFLARIVSRYLEKNVATSLAALAWRARPGCAHAVSGTWSSAEGRAWIAATALSKGAFNWVRFYILVRLLRAAYDSARDSIMSISSVHYDIYRLRLGQIFIPKKQRKG